MKEILFGAVFFSLATVACFAIGNWYVDEYKVRPAGAAVVETLQNSQDIDQLRGLALLTVKSEQQLVESYNRMLESSIELLGYLCMLAALIFLMGYFDLRMKLRKSPSARSVALDDSESNNI